MNRSISLSGIASVINKVDLEGAKEEVPSYLNSSTISASDLNTTSVKTLPSEASKVLEEFCTSKAIDKSNKDYLGRIDRLLRDNPNMDLCDAVKVAKPMESVLLNGIDLSKDLDFSRFVSSAVSKELSSFGYTGTVPDCLFSNIFSRLGSFGGFSGLSIKQKLSLLSLLGDSCGMELASGLMEEAIASETFKSVLDGLLDVSEETGLTYIVNRATEYPERTIASLESLLNEKEGKHTSVKMKALQTLLNENKHYVSRNPVDLDIVVSSLAINASEATFPAGMLVSTNADAVSSSVLKDQDKLVTMAVSDLNNQPSKDSLDSLEKTTDINLATKILLVNNKGTIV